MLAGDASKCSVERGTTTCKVLLGTAGVHGIPRASQPEKGLPAASEMQPFRGEGTELTGTPPPSVALPRVWNPTGQGQALYYLDIQPERADGVGLVS
jgi:hypothetical protein